MLSKRMRVFAGPNGSGKTTIFKSMLSDYNISLGIYVNADEIELLLYTTYSLDFNDYQISVSDELLKDFFRHSNFSPQKRNELDLWSKLSVSNNILNVFTSIDSYLTADIAEFIRQQLLIHDISFTYETVMSHKGKIDFFKKAQEKGFRVYLYYIATEDPEINVSRINFRVEQKGHNVAPEIVKNRYYKSLSNLYEAVKHTHRAFIFDNSQSQAKLISEITNGSEVALDADDELPNWVSEYLLSQIF